MFDKYIGQLDDTGATIVITADHGMKPKSQDDGSPNAIFLQDYFIPKNFENQYLVVFLRILRFHFELQILQFQIDILELPR